MPEDIEPLPFPVGTFVDPSLDSPEAVLHFVKKTYAESGAPPRGILEFIPALSDDALAEIAALEIARVEKMPLESEKRPRRDSDVIRHLAIQTPEVLHPHLASLFELDVNGTNFAELPWRRSGKAGFEFLRQAAWNQSFPVKKRLRAWQAMIATGDKDVLIFVAEHWSFMLECLREAYPWTRKHPPTLNTYLHRGANVEWNPAAQAFRPLVPRTCYHIRFDATHEEGLSGDRRLPHHPTWRHPKPNVPAGTHGGAGGDPCVLCGYALFGILTFQPIPDGLGVTGLNYLRLATCLKCFPWEHDVLFFRHDAPSGEPVQLRTGKTPKKVDFDAPAEPLPQGDVWLTPTPRRWHYQYWGNGNNLNKLGGAPDWVQDTHFPNCPQCEKTMPYLAQLDDDFPGYELWSGDSGHLYIFWCDACKVSGWHVQCC